MEDIAVQLFELGDQENKGFIIKRDMQRLQSEVALPPDQLEAVFESLDASQSGYLTLDQFLAGVNHLQCDGITRTRSEPDLYIQRLLNLNVLHKSGELMCEVRSLVGSEDSWHHLLAALFSDLNQLLRQISHLEDTLKARDRLHQEELQRLYDEFENQVSEEREIQNKQRRQKEIDVRAELTAELSAKEQLIVELVEQRDDLQERLFTAQSQLNSGFRKSVESLSDQKKDDEKNREREQARQNLEQCRRKADLQAERSYAEGFSHAQHLAMLEEKGLVKQLRLLQEMQENLKAGRIEDKYRKLSFEDL